MKKHSDTTDPRGADLLMYLAVREHALKFEKEYNNVACFHGKGDEEGFFVRLTHRCEADGSLRVLEAVIDEDGCAYVSVFDQERKSRCEALNDEMPEEYLPLCCFDVAAAKKRFDDLLTKLFIDFL
jgi:hypothetical protein